MSTINSCSFSDDLVSYLIGEGSKEERDGIKRHLLTCSSCLKDMEELQEAWSMIPYKLDDVEVPSDLKEEVMHSIFQTENIQPKKRFNLVKLYGMAAAIFLLAFASVLWNNVILRNQLNEVTKQAQTPAQVIEVFTLKSSTPSNILTQGKAILYQQGEKKQLVFQLEGLADTKGTQAYHVWLIHEGERRSAGVFHVDEEGHGVLTYELKETEAPFEAIGISLEPDANGTQPRGQKVLGT
ncbi:anti-sigma factor [Neobacillus niacini]|uniref:anti-sigma factor n=1 Tax=Neobacillus niacini TaxID=86668 RepID=UPI002FFE5637